MIATKFNTIQTADDGPSKPDPTILFKAITEIGVQPTDTIMVGDTTFDVEMAKRAEVHCLGVYWGNHDATILRAAAAFEIAGSFDEILRLTAQHIRRGANQKAKENLRF
ncbi:HAD-IA family hydrolase [Agrobacterium cavarae]|uniref:HAD-IA family hydrolase n=1 Tax=Agrobacterium cavarae TaxID=2528239 RepID=UPI003FD16188